MLAPGEEYDDRLIAFGDAPGNRLTLPQIEMMLRIWHAREPEHMGSYIAEAVTGAPPKRRRGQ